MRLRHAQRLLRATLKRRDTLSSVVRDAYGEAAPAKIAALLIDRVASWLPATAWGVIVNDGTGELSLIASRGSDEEIEPALFAVGAWVVEHGTEFLAGDLGRDRRVASALAATVIGLPMVCRGSAIGALVGIEPESSRGTPRLDAAMSALWQTVLEPVALAIEQALRLQKAEALSVTDDLTGLYNSRYLKEAIFRETKRALRYGRPLSLLFIDLDGFKSVNDTHGHLCGSRALVESGAVIRGCARESDVVARYGGDEFVVLLPETVSEGAVVVAKRIRDRLAEHCFLASHGLDVRLTASVGVATLPDVGTTPEDLLQGADRAMYEVKERGKNGYRLASKV